MIPTLSVLKTTSVCSDCGLCPEGRCADDLDPIIQEVVRRVRGQGGSEIPIPVGVSARHAHVSLETLEILFGKGHELTPFRELYQPGAFAAEELISVVGPRLRAIERVRILGPCRDYDQVELARTDAIYIGADPPMRDSGDLDGASLVTFIGPNGSVTTQGAIRAARHIHLRPSDVGELDLIGQDAIRVRVGGEKGLIYENVRLKIDASYLPEIHLDTDDANAADLTCGNTAYILK